MKFKDSLNTAVITTRFIVKEGKPVLSVFHHEEDGAWEFIGEDVCETDGDYMVVSLQEMIALDASILDVADLPVGMSAVRKNAASSWSRM